MKGSPAFRHRTSVTPADIDDLGHANNACYLSWILDAATAHWAVLKRSIDPQVAEAALWVVRRHEIEYLKQAFEGDQLDVFTWVPSCTASTCDRATEIERAADGVVIARCLSVYCVIEPRSGRPRRLSDDFRAAIGNPPRVERDRRPPVFPQRPRDSLLRRGAGDSPS